MFEKKSAKEVADLFGYTKTAIYSLARDFKEKLANNELDQYLFAKLQPGRNKKQNDKQLKDKIIALRKKYLSVEEIKENLDAKGEDVSETYIYHTVKNAGFARLPRRTKLAKKNIQSSIIIEAPKAEY